MKRITVNTSDRYDVIIEKGILKNCADYIKAVTNAEKFAVITDDIVAPLYFDTVENSLTNAGVKVCRFVIPHGEPSKCSAVLNDVYDFLSQNCITRSDCIIALGGGVVGDLAGFASATYLRGLDFIQIPTTLLAQVDSSVGGKTAIDLPNGKNLVGAFKQPKIVLCDPDVLNTLDEYYLIDGMGEVIKYGMIKSEELFNIVNSHDISNINSILDDIIYRCVSIKRDIVEKDEFDKGERMLLNFGHTLGHAIEKCSNFTGISHGRAVAAGMMMITEIAEKDGMCYDGTLNKLKACLEKYKLADQTDFVPAELAKTCLNDKKRDCEQINIIICSDIGDSKAIKMSIEDFLVFLN